MNTEIVKQENDRALLTPSKWELAQRMAMALSKSSIIPDIYQNNVANCLIALEMANRMNASPMMVMQNLYIVHGRPSWSGQFIVAAINSTGKFSPLRFDLKGEGETRSCIAWATELGTNERLEGPAVSIQMAKDEGWYGKNGSKWKTMPELMLRYRSATFFGRLYAPEVLMGMRESDEVIDIESGGLGLLRPVFPPLPQPISPTPVEPPPKRGRPKKTLEQPISPTSAQIVARHLEKDAITDDELLAVANELGWVDNVWEVAKFTDDQLTALIAHWEEVKLQVSDYRASKETSVTGTARQKPATKQDPLFQ